VTASTAVADARLEWRARSHHRARYWVGPAFVASMAYVDPGNFGTNFVAGGVSGYGLVWIVVLANVIAMFVQSLSAKLGLATGRSLAGNCREHYSRPTVWLLWGQAELMAVATDVAEIVGGAIALHLLFGLPIVLGGVFTAAAAVGMLAMQSRGRRPYEFTVVAFMLVIIASLVYVAVAAPISPAGASHGLLPGFSGSDSFLLATGILGATVMPHVVYLHSSLVADLDTSVVAHRRRNLRVLRGEIVVALGLAGAVNLVMLLIAAATRTSGPSTRAGTSIGHIHAVLGQALGHPASTAFALSLLASGLASASVGTLAGQTMMKDFLGRSIPIGVRRAATLVPALAILVLGTDPTTVLVLSQVVLSLALPFALLPLLLLTRSARLMGELCNRRPTTVAAWGVSGLVIALNVTAVVSAVGG
jgi:manganese transport protein